MAYSATLIPHLEKEDAEVHATQEETSWIGEITRTRTNVSAPDDTKVAEELMCTRLHSETFFRAGDNAFAVNRELS